MRRLLLLAAAVLLAPATAGAAPFGELPFRPVPGVATCVRATGTPGELARWTRDGVELLRADADGLAASGEVPLGPGLACPEIAGQPDGAAVAAVDVRSGVRVAVREPGGRFGAPVALPVARSSRLETAALAVAASPRGDAVVAVLFTDPIARRARVVAFRRSPGGAFGALEPIAAWRGRADFDGLAAGVDGSGRATLAWSREATSITEAVEAASAAPGGAFGAPVRVGTSSPTGGGPALAVAPDGRALIAFEADGTGVTIAERAPGADRFGPAAPVADPPQGGTEPAVALADGGAAAVAWRTDRIDRIDGIRLSSRAAAGPLGAPREVAKGSRRQGGNRSISELGGGSPQDTPRLAVALAGPDVVLGWAGHPEYGGSGVMQAATGALAGGPIEHSALGSTVRPALSLAPFTVAGGRAAVGWADDATELGSFATGQGRLHLALAGAPPAAEPPAVRVSVPRLERRRQYVDDPVVVPVRCSGPCDVRATLRGSEYPAMKVASRGSAGLLRLRLAARLDRRTRSVDVALRYGAPGSHASETRRVRVPVVVRRSPPVPAPVGVRARRSGGDVVVTWHASFASAQASFAVLAEDRRRRLVAYRGFRSHGRRSFRITLRGGGSARTVTVVASGHADRRERRATVRVR